MSAELGVQMLQQIYLAKARIAPHLPVTPCLYSETLSVLADADVYLKFENQQFTASFKERGALNRLLQLSDAERRDGVIAMSAGNHAQAVARHCKRLGIPACIVMPRSTPNAKVEQSRVFDPEIILHGNQFDETLAFTKELARSRQLTLVHPYDDEQIIAGQGTLGLELLDQVPDLEAVIVPVGGGGLIGGVSTAIKQTSPLCEVIGVQVRRFASVYNSHHNLAGEILQLGTVAEGIAVKQPGERNMALIRDQVDDMLLVSEAEVESAIFSLLELEKSVVEGAGATPLAALLGAKEKFRHKKVVLVLSGGNIDMMILSSVLQRGLVRTNRLVRLSVEIRDVPGALGDLTRILGELDSNIMDIVHQRAFGGSSVRATLVELVLQMRGEEQADVVLSALAQAGYEARLLE